MSQLLDLHQYDKASAYFEVLQYFTALHANPGLFYRALTLIERDQPGDISQAKPILQAVVSRGLEGKETASDWLKNM